jgi:hypothetical protein
MKWEEALWAELEAQSDIQQIITAAEWINHLTQKVLPDLGGHRRRKILEVLAQPEMDATRLAESIGARRTTISRLAEEGRAAAREERERVA